VGRSERWLSLSKIKSARLVVQSAWDWPTKKAGSTFAHRVGRSAAECRISPVEVTAAMLRRIAEVDPRLQPYTTVTSEEALS
jgi:hypothetical protein